uniref:Uncharacterized protein n=1 Tax=Arundo donax TaxID=35708 RepID=A0A0A9CNA1_ARUDO
MDSIMATLLSVPIHLHPGLCLAELRRAPHQQSQPSWTTPRTCLRLSLMMRSLHTSISSFSKMRMRSLALSPVHLWRIQPSSPLRSPLLTSLRLLSPHRHMNGNL